MPCPRRRPSQRCLMILGALLLAPFVWVALLAIVPTDCARLKIAERLGRATGRQVTLGRLRVGALGRVELVDLRIGASGSDVDPWLHIDQATIDVSLGQLLFGQFDPTRIDVKGAQLRILRRPDGRLELADLLGTHRDPSATSPGSDPVDRDEPKSLDVRVVDATIWLLDEPTGTRLKITEVEARGTCHGSLVSVTSLHGNLNDGTVQLAAQYDRTDVSPRFEGHLRVRGAGLGQGMNALGYLVPVLVGTRPGLEGRLTLDLYLRGQGDSHAALAETLVGQGRIGLDPIALDGSRLLAGIGDLFALEDQGRVGDVWADLTIRNGRVTSENLTVDVAKVPVVLTGWTDFDGRISYRLKTDGLIDKLPGRAQEFLSQLKPELKLNELADVRIEGTVDALSVTAHGLPIARNPASQPIHEIGHRVRDQLSR